MGKKCKFMTELENILQKDLTFSYFLDKRSNGKYRIKILGRESEFTEKQINKIKSLPHVIKVYHTGPKSIMNYYRGLSITLDCRPSKAI